MKLAIQNSSEKNSVFQKKNKSSFAKEHKTIASKFINIDNKPMMSKSNGNQLNESPRTSNKNKMEKNESPRRDQLKSIPSATSTTSVKNTESTTTVESLLTSLDKIEKESTELFKVDSKQNMNGNILFYLNKIIYL